MRRGLLVLLAAVVAAVAFPVPVAAAGAPAARVLVVGAPGLRWDHVSPTTTPALWALAGRGSVASLSVRAGTAVTRRLDGWLTLGAGNRARARSASLLPLRPDGRDPEIDRFVADNERLLFDTEIAALGTALHAAGRTTAAVGRGAVIGLVDGAGRVDVVPTVPGAPTVVTSVLPRELPTADVVGYELLGAYAPAPTPAALAQLDQDVARVAQTRRPQDTLLVLGLSDGPVGPPALHVAIAFGPRFQGGRLVSASTRRAGFVQLIDLAPTILDLLAVPRPDGVVGQPARRTGGRSGNVVADLVDDQLAADAHRRYVPPFFTLLVATQLLLYFVAWRGLRRRRRGSAGHFRLRSFTHQSALAFACVPAATYLVQTVPWWRYRLWFLLLAVAAVTALLHTVATRGPWRRHVLGPVGAISAITALVLALDLLTGARLQMSSLAGYSPIVAGRFAGVGNVAFAVFATSALLATAALARNRSRRARLALVVGVGTVAVVIDGSPLWGSDFGGVLALVPGFAVLGMLLLGTRVSVPRLLAVLGLGVLLVTTFAFLDYTREADARTHLGRFVQQVVDGQAGTVVRRKANANLRLLTHSVLTLVVPLAVAFLAFVLLRPWGGLRRALQRADELRAGLIAVLVMAVVGFLANDSGVAVPSFALTLAVPIALAVSIRVAEEDERHADG
jgi:hypothetical protein